MSRSPRRRAVFCALFTAALSLHRPHGTAAVEPPPSLPVLGVDPVVSGLVMEDSANAIAYWVGKGFTGAVLLHIGAYPQLSAVRPGNLEALKVMGARGDTVALAKAGSGGREALYDERNLVYLAGALGVAREVVWVMPYTFLLAEDPAVAAGQVRDYLGQAGLSGAEIGSFRIVDGCARGVARGIPLTLCVQERLPEIAGPVLLSFDAGFLPRAAAHRHVTPLSELRALFANLRGRRYAVRDTVVAWSVQSGGLPPDLRWIGEALIQALQDPELLQGGSPPERWRALEKLHNLRRKAGAEGMEVLGAALEELERRPLDPAVLLFTAEAAAGHGGGERALLYAEQACRMERGSCAGLTEIGLRLLEAGNVEAALRFFASAERLRPGMEYGLIDKAILFGKVERPAEALAALEREIERHGAFPGGFLAGAIHLFTGDRAAARLAFDQAAAALAQTPDFAVTREEIAESIRRAAAFYREEGLLQQVEQLHGDPRLRRSVFGGGS